MKKIFIVYHILFHFFYISTFADGKTYSYEENKNYTTELNQQTQNAVIIYSKGIQELYININVNIEHSDEFLWIFPIKSNVTNVTCSILDKFPIIQGTKLVKDQTFLIDDLYTSYIKIDQIINLSFIPFISNIIDSQLQHMRDTPENSLKKFFNIEKYGLNLSYRSVETEIDFKNFILKTGKTLSNNEIEHFKSYFSKDFTFFIAHIKNLKTFKKKFNSKKYSPALKIVFPSKKIFYPMKATMSYKNSPSLYLSILGNVDLINQQINIDNDQYKITKIDNINIKENYTFFNLYIWNSYNKFKPQDLFFKINQNTDNLKIRELFTNIKESKYLKYLIIYILFFISNFLIYLLILKKFKKSIKKNWIYGLWLNINILPLMINFEKIHPGKNTVFINKKKIWISYFIFIFSIAIFTLCIQIGNHFVNGNNQAFYQYLNIFSSFCWIIFIILFFLFQIVKILFFYNNHMYRIFCIFSFLNLMFIPIIIANSLLAIVIFNK